MLKTPKEYNVTSLFDGLVKFTGLLFKCQQWIGEHGSQWHMHTVSPC